MSSNILLLAAHRITGVIGLSWILKPVPSSSYARAKSPTESSLFPKGTRLWHRRFRGVALVVEEQHGDFLAVTVDDAYGVALGEPPVGAQLKVNKSDVYRY